MLQERALPVLALQNRHFFQGLEKTTPKVPTFGAYS
jgi:hypothetical protein